MEPTLIDGKSYYPASVVADLWNYKESTIKRYANPSSGKLPGCIKHNGVLYVPSESIRPITQSVAQGWLWGIVGIKNDPASFLDLTAYSIDNSQLNSVLDDLARQLYLQVDPEEQDVRKKLVEARITERGFSLIRYKRRFSENPIADALTPESISLVLTLAQTVMQVIQLSPNQ